MKTIIGLFVTIYLVCVTGGYYVGPSAPVPAPAAVCPCQYKYNPVCGSDGVTYMNKCVLNCTNILNLKMDLPPICEVQYSECRGTCNCQNVELPVCTLDGVTYPNECELSCENIKRIETKQPIIYLAYRSACVGPPGKCTDIAAPVCGTDNVLYRNKCVLEYATYGSEQQGLPPIQVKNIGACQDSCLCPITNQKVCGCNANIYKNACELECENEKRSRIYMPAIKEANPKVCEGCYCTANFEPVCANDGKTYSNPCQLGCEIRRQNSPDLKALHSGPC